MTIAKRKYPFPSRTRKSSSLSVDDSERQARESRPLPDFFFFKRGRSSEFISQDSKENLEKFKFYKEGWLINSEELPLHNSLKREIFHPICFVKFVKFNFLNFEIHKNFLIFLLNISLNLITKITQNIDGLN